MENIKRKRGPKPLRDKPMTGVERNKRQRAKELCYVKAAESSGYKLYPILISTKQLESLARYYYLDSSENREARGNGPTIDNARINDVVYHAMKMYLDGLRSNLIERRFPIEVVKYTLYPE